MDKASPWMGLRIEDIAHQMEADERGDVLPRPYVIEYFGENLHQLPELMLAINDYLNQDKITPIQKRGFFNTLTILLMQFEQLWRNESFEAEPINERIQQTLAELLKEEKHRFWVEYFERMLVGYLPLNESLRELGFKKLTEYALDEQQHVDFEKVIFTYLYELSRSEEFPGISYYDIANHLASCVRLLPRNEIKPFLEALISDKLKRFWSVGILLIANVRPELRIDYLKVLSEKLLNTKKFELSTRRFQLLKYYLRQANLETVAEQLEKRAIVTPDPLTEIVLMQGAEITQRSTQSLVISLKGEEDVQTFVLVIKLEQGVVVCADPEVVPLQHFPAWKKDYKQELQKIDTWTTLSQEYLKMILGRFLNLTLSIDSLTPLYFFKIIEELPFNCFELAEQNNETWQLALKKSLHPMPSKKTTKQKTCEWFSGHHSIRHWRERSFEITGLFKQYHEQGLDALLQLIDRQHSSRFRAFWAAKLLWQALLELESDRKNKRFCLDALAYAEDLTQGVDLTLIPFAKALIKTSLQSFELTKEVSTETVH